MRGHAASGSSASTRLTMPAMRAARRAVPALFEPFDVRREQRAVDAQEPGPEPARQARARAVPGSRPRSVPAAAPVVASRLVVQQPNDLADARLR